MKLDFDDDTADRRALEQQHDEIGAIFGGLHSFRRNDHHRREPFLLI